MSFLQRVIEAKTIAFLKAEEMAKKLFGEKLPEIQREILDAAQKNKSETSIFFMNNNTQMILRRMVKDYLIAEGFKVDMSVHATATPYLTVDLENLPRDNISEARMGSIQHT